MFQRKVLVPFTQSTNNLEIKITPSLQKETRCQKMHNLWNPSKTTLSQYELVYSHPKSILKQPKITLTILKPAPEAKRRKKKLEM